MGVELHHPDDLNPYQSSEGDNLAALLDLITRGGDPRE
jgi:hypothetical protein